MAHGTSPARPWLRNTASSLPQEEQKPAQRPAPAAPKSWQTDAAAPVVTDRDTANALRDQLAARAEQAGVPLKTDAPVLTENADLHLVTDSGHIIRKIREVDGKITFMVPPGVESVSLVSRITYLDETAGLTQKGRSPHGVLVGEITFFEAGRTRPITDHLKTEGLSGWGRVQDKARWTQGKAALPLAHRRPRAIGMLAVQLRATGEYDITPTTERIPPIRA
ncbi:hypothetical protein [Acetobacter cibinongensis]|uniref:Uncharacterized protein n=1 Tax=Acetobacter cibinongensis TaxID=146475 RepID=A0A1Z5YZ77_9PROT|nr:hypothetical protein [Acetobacter cibinongensis]OUJ04641.1 hypothetical protein HK14_00375 [Acetobacter cibinongensis]